MWEEDPKFQEVQYRCLLWTVAAATGIVAAMGVWFSDWSIPGYWLTGLAVLLSALGVYAAIIGCAAVLVRWAKRFCK